MKKILLLLSFISSTLFSIAETTDIVYASQISYDSDYDLYYFDVCLEGSTNYTGYGLDIQLPQGLEVAHDGDDIYVLRVDDIYPTYGLKKEITHSVTPSLPEKNDFSHIRVGCMSSKNLDLKETSGTLFRVYLNVNYTSGWPIGAIRLYDVELNVLSDNTVTPYNPNERNTIVAVHSGETSLPLTVSATNHWSTCILPFATEIPEGVKAYTSSTSDSENIYLTEASSIEAYTPYILYSENGYSGNVSGTVDANGYPESGIVTAGNLTGAIVPQTVTSGYILQKHDVVKFYAIKNGDSFLVPAGKCWMNIARNNVKAFNFVIEDDETAIRSISTTTADDTTYDLTGRRISNTKQGGIYIKNGKKVMN